jgi:hypothetical protein
MRASMAAAAAAMLATDERAVLPDAFGSREAGRRLNQNANFRISLGGLPGLHASRRPSR